MSREIKFRAWDKRKDCYFEEDTFYVAGDDGEVITLKDGMCCGYVISDEDFILEQYTGLKDKNGVEIYEGDVVYVAGIGNLEVYHDEGFIGFCFRNSHDEFDYQHIIEDLQIVVGNIHEGVKNDRQNDV